MLLAYAYTCDVQPRDNPLMGYCNLISITKASPLTHFVVIGYFILINIQIASIFTEDNSPFKVKTFWLKMRRRGACFKYRDGLKGGP